MLTMAVASRIIQPSRGQAQAHQGIRFVVTATILVPYRS
jgi:hypothetical protein